MTLMKKIIPFLFLLTACSPKEETTGIYTGEADLRDRLRQFTALNENTKKKIILNRTGIHELSFYFNDKVSHLDYEEEVITIRSEEDKSEWTAKKVKGGFELEDGSVLKYAKCADWEICLVEAETKAPVLKGRYELNGNKATLSLWISDSEKHVELLGLMANGLINRSRDHQQSIESSLETLSAPVWVY